MFHICFIYKKYEQLALTKYLLNEKMNKWMKES